MAQEKKDSSWFKQKVSNVLLVVKDVPQSVRDTVQFWNFMIKEFPVFYKVAPGILRIVINEAGDFDVQKFEIMLAKLRMVEAGQVSLEEMNRRIGQEEFDHYVAPIVEKAKEEKKDS